MKLSITIFKYFAVFVFCTQLISCDEQIYSFQIEAAAAGNTGNLPLWQITVKSDGAASIDFAPDTMLLLTRVGAIDVTREWSTLSQGARAVKNDEFNCSISMWEQGNAKSNEPSRKCYVKPQSVLVLMRHIADTVEGFDKDKQRLAMKLARSPLLGAERESLGWTPSTLPSDK